MRELELRDLDSGNLIMVSEPKRRRSTTSSDLEEPLLLKQVLKQKQNSIMLLDNNSATTIHQEEMNNREIVHFIEARKAAMFGEVERLRELLDSGQVHVDAADPDDCTLLHWAAINNRIEVKTKFFFNEPDCENNRIYFLYY